MFIIGDIVARREAQKGKDIFFPIASHYSGNTAQNISETFRRTFSNSDTLKPNDKKILFLYKNIYRIPQSTIKTFVKPLNILNFFNNEILWELKSLNVSGDYGHSYTTKHKDFPKFINTILSLYEKNNVLITNKNKDLALNYEDEAWKKEAIKLLNKIEFIQPFHKNNVLTGIGNIRSDWEILRDDGFGVRYQKNKNLIVDPMFDSELFTLFDLYVKFKNDSYNKQKSAEQIFENLFDVLKNKKKPKNKLVRNITKWLPCDLFICEEHLKNWVAKKIYAESLLLDKHYQTKKYFILGMGLLNGKRMSASKGNAVLARDLIINYGATKARLIILLNGGHPSKTYAYDQSVPKQIDILLNNFTNYYTHLLSVADGKFIENKKELLREEKIKAIQENIEKHLDNYYYRQAIIELLSIIPKEYPDPSQKTAGQLIFLYQKYLDVLLPNLLSKFK